MLFRLQRQSDIAQHELAGRELQERFCLPWDRAVSLTGGQQLFKPFGRFAEGSVTEGEVTRHHVERPQDGHRALPGSGQGKHGVGLLTGAPIIGLQRPSVVILVTTGTGDGNRLWLIPPPPPGIDRASRNGLRPVLEKGQPCPQQVALESYQCQATLDQRLPEGVGCSTVLERPCNS